MKNDKNQLVERIRNWFLINGRTIAVIGISGGKDSAVVAGLCAEAIGANNVYGVIMPNGKMPSEMDAERVIEELGIRRYYVQIGPVVTAMHSAVRETGVTPSEQAAINLPPRIRMACLYEIAQSIDGEHSAVVGTSNRSEIYVGYTTKWGDSACDYAPISDLWVEEVIAVGEDLGHCLDIVHKAPSDELCGKTDEENLGFSYAQVRSCAENGPQSVPTAIAEKIQIRHKKSEHKRHLPSAF